MTEKTTQMIYPALIAILRDIAQEGIGKNRKNAQQGYQFRGVDDVMNAFAPLLSKHGIAIVPRFEERIAEERATKSGGTLFLVTLKGTFRLFAEDGSFVEVGPIYGEASDTADKATNKAMAVAFKYALFQAFCVPLEGVTGGDADEQTHEVRAKAPVEKHPSASRASQADFESLKAKREEMGVSQDDVVAYVGETFGVKPQAMTSEQVRHVIAWLDLGAPAQKVPA